MTGQGATELHVFRCRRPGAEQARESVISAEGRLSAPFQTWTFGPVLIEVERGAARK